MAETAKAWTPPEFAESHEWTPPEFSEPATSTHNAPEPESAVGSFFRPLARGIFPAAATAVGGTLSGLAAAETGPGAIAADIAGGAASGAGAEWLQNKILGEENVKSAEAQEAANREAHPFAASMGGMIPGLLSAVGGNPTGLTKEATQLAHLGAAAVSGARMAGSEEAQKQAEQGKFDPGALAEAPIRGAITMGPTGLVPGAKSLLEGIYQKSIPDALVMAVANNVYDYAAHGKPLDPSAIAKESGESIPGFVLLNLATGLLHGHPLLSPKESPTEPAPNSEVPPEPPKTSVGAPEPTSATTTLPTPETLPTAIPTGKEVAPKLLESVADQFSDNPDIQLTAAALRAGADEISDKPSEEPKPAEENALQEPSPGEVLQREQGETNTSGSGRERVESGQQGNETSREGEPEALPGSNEAEVANETTPEGKIPIGVDEQGKIIYAERGDVIHPNDVAPAPLPEPRDPHGATLAHANQLMDRLKATPLGRALAKDANIVQTPQEALDHPSMEGIELTDSDRQDVLNNHMGGIYNPKTGKSVIILDGLKHLQGNTPEMDIRSALIHERLAHESLNGLYQISPEFRRKMDALTKKIQKSGSRMKGYENLSDEDRFHTLAEEYVAKLAEGQRLDDLVKQDPIFSTIWKGFKDWIAKRMGKYKSDASVDELAREIIRDVALHAARQADTSGPRFQSDASARFHRRESAWERLRMLAHQALQAQNLAPGEREQALRNRIKLSRGKSKIAVVTDTIPSHALNPGMDEILKDAMPTWVGVSMLRDDRDLHNFMDRNSDFKVADFLTGLDEMDRAPVPTHLVPGDNAFITKGNKNYQTKTHEVIALGLPRGARALELGSYREALKGEIEDLADTIKPRYEDTGVMDANEDMIKVMDQGSKMRLQAKLDDLYGHGGWILKSSSGAGGDALFTRDPNPKFDFKSLSEAPLRKGMYVVEKLNPGLLEHGAMEARVHGYVKNGKLEVVPYATGTKEAMHPYVARTDFVKELEEVTESWANQNMKGLKDRDLFGFDVGITPDGKVEFLEVNPTLPPSGLGGIQSKEAGYGMSGYAARSLYQMAIASHLAGQEPPFAIIARELMRKQISKSGVVDDMARREQDLAHLHESAEDFVKFRLTSIKRFGEWFGDIARPVWDALKKLGGKINDRLRDFFRSGLEQNAPLEAMQMLHSEMADMSPRFSRSGPTAEEVDQNKEQDRRKVIRRAENLEAVPKDEKDDIVDAKRERSGYGPGRYGRYENAAQRKQAMDSIQNAFDEYGKPTVKDKHQVGGQATADEKLIQHHEPIERFLNRIFSGGESESDVPMTEENHKILAREVKRLLTYKTLGKLYGKNFREWHLAQGGDNPGEEFWQHTGDAIGSLAQNKIEDLAGKWFEKTGSPEDLQLAKELSYFANQAVIGGDQVTKSAVGRMLRASRRSAMNFIDQLRAQRWEFLKSFEKGGGDSEQLNKSAQLPEESIQAANAAERQAAQSNPKVKAIEEAYRQEDLVAQDKADQKAHEKEAIQSIDQDASVNKEKLAKMGRNAKLIQRALRKLKAQQEGSSEASFSKEEASEPLPDDILKLLTNEKSLKDRIADLKEALKNNQHEIDQLKGNAEALKDARKMLSGEEEAKKIIKQQEEGRAAKAASHPVRQRWWDQVRKPSDEESFMEDMRKLGVSDETAQALHDLADEQKQSYAEKQSSRDQQNKEKYAGTLNEVFQKVLAMDPAAQGRAADRKQVIKDALKEKGFSEDRADKDATILSGKDGPWHEILANERSKAMMDAAANMPYFKKLQAAKSKPQDHEKWKRDMKRISNLVHEGAFDPEDALGAVITEGLGYKPFTTEENQKLASMLNEAETANPHRQADLYVQALEMLRHHAMPREWKEMTTDAFRASMLSSMNVLSMDTTMGAFSYASKLGTDLMGAALLPEKGMSRLDAMHYAIKNWADPLKTFIQGAQFAGKRNAYTLHRAGQMSHFVSLSKEMEDAHQLMTSEKSNPAQKAKGAIQWLQASTQLVYRILSGGAQAWYEPLLENQLKQGAVSKLLQKGQGDRPGLSKDRIMRILNGEETFRDNDGKLMTRNVFDDALRDATDRGLAPDQAAMDAKDEMHKWILGQVSQHAGHEGAGRVKDVASLEARAKMGEHYGDPGFFFSKIGQMVVNGVAGMNKQHPFLGRLVSSFVRIPFNLLNTAVWMSPAGFARIGIHNWHVAHGKESPYGKVALAHPELQMRQRLIEATAGTVALGAMLALRRKKEGDDGFFITGDGPQNKSARDAWQKQGYKPGSIGYKSGDKIVSVPWARGGLERFKIPAILAGAVDDMELNHTELSPQKAESIANYASLALQAAGKQSNFLNLKNLPTGSTTGPSGTQMAATATGLASNIIPWASLLKSVGRVATDAPDHSNIQAAVLAQIPVVSPFASQRAINVFGDPLGDQPNHTLLKSADKAWWAGLPLYVNPGDPERSSPLYQTVLSRGIMPSMPERSHLEQANGPMTEARWHDFAEMHGKMVKQAMLQRLPSLQSLPIKEAHSEVERLSNDATKVTKARMGLR